MGQLANQGSPAGGLGQVVAVYMVLWVVVLAQSFGLWQASVSPIGDAINLMYIGLFFLGAVPKMS